MAATESDQRKVILELSQAEWAIVAMAMENVALDLACNPNRLINHPHFQEKSEILATLGVNHVEYRAFLDRLLKMAIGLETPKNL